MEKTIYNMELHEIIKLPDIRIVRVPGGWIYLVDCYGGGTGRSGDSDIEAWYERPVFVPFHNGFQNPDPTIEAPKMDKLSHG